MNWSTFFAWLNSIPLNCTEFASLVFIYHEFSEMGIEEGVLDIEKMATKFLINKGTLYRYLSALIDRGILIRKITRKEKGQIDRILYKINFNKKY